MELYQLDGRVCLWFGGDAAFEHFKKTAADEGFRLPQGSDDILALQDDLSFCHPGFIGHIGFYQCPTAYSGKKLIRVDYIKWISGKRDYLYRKTEKQ